MGSVITIGQHCNAELHIHPHGNSTIVGVLSRYDDNVAWFEKDGPQLGTKQDVIVPWWNIRYINFDPRSAR